MSKLHSVHVARIIRETPDCVSIEFDIPDELLNRFLYLAGQHIVVRKIIGGEDVRRTYSLHNGPSRGQFRIAVRQIDEGKFSTYANETLKVGDKIEISEPFGMFVLNPPRDHSANFVAFAAGSGITPIMAMIDEVLIKDNTSRFFLYYGNRDKDHTIFAEQLAELKNRHMDRFACQFIFSRQANGNSHFDGRIDGKKAELLHKQVFQSLNVADYYLCGPLSMINAVRSSLIEAGEPADKIHSELFFASAEDALEAGERKNAPSAIAKSRITVISSGHRNIIDYRDDHGSVLEAALKAGIDVSFACKGGVCATCRAKVVEGNVNMANNYGLEPEEVEAGFVLTCQSVPLTDTVTISFDE